MAKDLRHFLAQLARDYPDDLVEVSRQVRPAEFEVTALLEHLDRRGLYPAVHFLAPTDVQGGASEFHSTQQCVRDPRAVRRGSRFSSRRGKDAA